MDGATTPIQRSGGPGAIGLVGLRLKIIQGDAQFLQRLQRRREPANMLPAMKDASNTSEPEIP